MDPEHARAPLQAERTRIERSLGHVAHQDDGEPGDDEDPGNLASDLYQDELDEGLRDDLRTQLAALERAEARLAVGTYGLSIASGDPIPDERLELLPAAELTVEEERDRESGELRAGSIGQRRPRGDKKRGESGSEQGEAGMTR